MSLCLSLGGRARGGHPPLTTSAGDPKLPPKAQGPGTQSPGPSLCPSPLGANHGGFLRLSVSHCPHLLTPYVPLPLCLCLSQSLTHPVPLCSCVSVPLSLGPSCSRPEAFLMVHRLDCASQVGVGVPLGARVAGRTGVGGQQFWGPTGATAEQAGAMSRHDLGHLVRPGDRGRNELLGRVARFSK